MPAYTAQGGHVLMRLPMPEENSLCEKPRADSAYFRYAKISVTDPYDIPNEHRTVAKLLQ